MNHNDDIVLLTLRCVRTTQVSTHSHQETLIAQMCTYAMGKLEKYLL